MSRKLWIVALAMCIIMPQAKAQDEKKQQSPWTKEQKIEALSRFWAEARRNFVYMPKIGIANWDSLYRVMLPQVMESKDDYDFLRIMQRFCAFLKDGHTNIYASSPELRFTTTAFGDMEMEMDWVDGKLIVSAIDSVNARQIPPGTEIVAINDRPAVDYLREESEVYVSASAPHARRKQAAFILFQAPHGTTRKVTFLVGKKQIVRQVTNGYLPNNGPLIRLKGYKWVDYYKDFEYRRIDKKIAYIRIGTMDSEDVVKKFIDTFPQFQDAKGIILDLRNNGGGSSGNSANILSYLTSRQTLYGAAWRTRIYKPAFAAWGKYVTEKDTVDSSWAKECWLQVNDEAFTDREISVYPTGNHPRMEVPTIVLTNSNTASAAEDFLIFTDSLKNFVRMGEVTDGSTGMPIPIQLIPNMDARICAKEDTWPDGRAFVGVGVEPHIAVPVTVEALKSDKDIQLEAAIKELKKRIR